MGGPICGNPPMPANFYDAHCHWADHRLRRQWDAITPSLDAIGIERAVVNGTSPDDWPDVLALAENDARVLPAIGLHPWRVNEAPATWREALLRALDGGARAVGEIGLDRWVEGHDLQRQREAFDWQLTLAAERNLPVSIHCLKAVGPLLEALNDNQRPERGIHVHALNAPVPVFEELASLGAYFSFNAGQFKPHAKKVVAAVRAVSADRLLVETDAPDFRPHEESRAFDLPGELNHPANLRCSYQAIATIWGISVEELKEQTEANFRRYFLRSPSPPPHFS